MGDRSTLELCQLFAVVIIRVRVRSEEFPHGHFGVIADQHADLVGVGIFDDFDAMGGRHREISKIAGSRVDELMCTVASAGRASDHIVLPHGILSIAKAKRAFARKNQKHFFVLVVVVKRARTFAGGGES